ncbi:MAG: LysR family transcriptional regulator [Chlorobi bacterium]|nr:LysR family transcriptional regulator [Chlorobiota bacterium]
MSNKEFILNYKIWLSTEDGKGIMGDGKWQILKAIEKHGSLKAATEALGLTYRRTWGDLKQIEKDLGYPLLEKRRGGKHGGETTLTIQGARLVKAFDRFHKKTDRFMEKAFVELKTNLTNPETDN